MNLSHISYFATVYLGLDTDEIPYDEALVILDEYVGFPKIKNTQEALTYKELSYICTRVWNIKGGLLYSITKAPRYALRELKSLGYVASNIDPSTLVTGREALTIMTKCAEYAEAKGTLADIVVTEPIKEKEVVAIIDPEVFKFRR